MKTLISLGVAVTLATPLMFNTAPVHAEDVEEGPSPQAPEDSEVFFAPLAAYTAGVAFLRLSMMVASLEARSGNTIPNVEPIDQSQQAFD